MDNVKLVKNFRRLEAERKTLDSTLEVIRKFFVPFRGEFFEEQNDENQIDWRELRQVYDATGISAADRLAANVQSALVSPSMKWFKFKFRNDALNKDNTAAKWLEQCEDITYQELKDSNFDVESSEFFLDAVSFGTSVISEEAESELEWKGINFNAIPLVDCYFEEDAKSKILRFYRKFQWTPLQVFSKFGNETPKWIMDKQEEAASEKILVILCVCHNKDNAAADTTKVLEAGKRPYPYKYIVVKDASMIGAMGGYYEMPAFIARWRKVSGSKWGYSPAHVALSDVLTLNQITEDTLEALGKVIDPAILTTNRGLMSDLDLRRSGVTVVRDTRDVVPFESKARFDVGELKIERLQAAVRAAFYVDQLELKESPAMTATEVNARADMVLKLMGPTSGRMQNDFLDPCLERTFKIQMRANRFPETPQIVEDEDAELDIEYTGPMPRAQRQDLVMAINQWAGSIAQLAELNPGILQIPDWDAMARETAALAGVPVKLTRDQKIIDEERKAEQQKAEEQQQLAAVAQGGEAMKAIGEGAGAVGAVGGIPS